MEQLLKNGLLSKYFWLKISHIAKPMGAHEFILTKIFRPEMSENFLENKMKICAKILGIFLLKLFININFPFSS